MPSKLEEITVTFCHTKHRWENAGGATILAKVMGDSTRQITVKGPEAGELETNMTYRFYGRWKEYIHKHQRFAGKQKEKQFHFKTYVRATPYCEGGIKSYLCKIGAGKGFGPARAHALWKEYQGDAVRMMREMPDVVSSFLAARGLPMSDESIEAMAADLRDHEAIEATTLELFDLLDGRGFPVTTWRHALAAFGNLAPKIIARNPYVLMRFRGIGFKRTDAMYLDLGLPANALKRQALCAWYAIASNTEGHTWHPVEDAAKGIFDNMSGVEIDQKKALLLAKRAKILSFHRDDDGRVWVAETKKAEAEKRLADLLSKAAVEVAQWPVGVDTLDVSDHQRAKLYAALDGPVGCLGGSPGSGKTRSAACLISLIMREHGDGSIAIAAPTGKAAVRITEAMQSYGIGLRAKTIHSLLGVQSVEEGAGWTFRHNESCPLPYRFIVVDESSMIDTSLACSLLRARAAGTHVLFVGDVNQLPPVGHGAPLRDLIAANCPYGELREIRRNSGAIVETCAAIRDEKKWQPSERIDPENGENLFLLAAHSPEEQQAKILRALEAAKAQNLNPIWDCQVLAAVNKRSPMSRAELNKLLQSELNQHGVGASGSPFKTGDKIVCTKNGWYGLDDSFGETGQDDELETNDTGEVYVANGELACVIESTAKMSIASLDSPRRVIRIPRGGQEKEESSGGKNDTSSTGCNWELGYVLSCHRGQGSEWPVVLVVLDEYPGARMVCDRSWIYTAISRAKKLCLLVGKLDTAKRFCRVQKIDNRKTFLRELLLEGRAELQKAGLAE